MRAATLAGRSMGRSAGQTTMDSASLLHARAPAAAEDDMPSLQSVFSAMRSGTPPARVGGPAAQATASALHPVTTTTSAAPPSANTWATWRTRGTPPQSSRGLGRPMRFDSPAARITADVSMSLQQSA
ncbi:MAG: hypothetical protein BWY85_01309 [Firmicutes bacterium ADurb.Bin506]|nr:MAG: hypothetical protein BWY85_01309 [Firmicutes bacterium ADurb.Bin506]